MNKILLGIIVFAVCELIIEFLRYRNDITCQAFHDTYSLISVYNMSKPRFNMHSYEFADEISYNKYMFSLRSGYTLTKWKREYIVYCIRENIVDLKIENSKLKNRIEKLDKTPLNEIL